jgi:lipopolysaccharide/colanic/teichoic acid biosynthesis glycosyltransferase
MALAAGAIRVDSPGPIIHRQKRLGLNGRVFYVLKFRTMVRDAGVRITKDGVVQAAAKDTRVTRVGRWLRRTSLDELPQLVNVLVGEMSLVGPRPDLPEALGMYDDRERRRLDVKPGITGLAQVRGRNRLTAKQKWTLDIEYVDRHSIGRDLSILVRTVQIVLSRRDIYPVAPDMRKGQTQDG